MQNFITKIDASSADANGVISPQTTLTAAEFNNYINELENAVTASGQTLTSEDVTQLAKSLTNHALVSQYFNDSGSINTYTLNAGGNYKPPSGYIDGMRIRFFAGNTNTGPSTVNIASIGSQNIRRLDGSALQANDITTGSEIELTFRASLGYFILSQNVKTSGNQTITDKKTFTTTPSANSDPINSTDLIRLSFLQSYVSANAQSALPSGSIVAYSGTTAPTGFLLPAGQAVSRTTFSTLFSVIGTTYGSGDGSTTFTLPDLRGRTIHGKDDMNGGSANRVPGNGTVLGAAGGAATVTLNINNLPAHTHDTTLFSSAGSGIASNGNNNGNVTTQTGSTGNNSPFSVMEPYIILNYIIKV